MIKKYVDFVAEAIDPEFDLESTGRPDWDKDLLDTDRFHVEFIYMRPGDFLSRVQHERFVREKEKEKLSGGPIPAPTMWFMNKTAYEKGLAPSWHDGSHRARALAQAGVSKMPVRIVWEK